jgi:hypothetical protein
MADYLDKHDELKQLLDALPEFPASRHWTYTPWVP